MVATIAFWAYTQTLLPGVDLGDTGGLQAAVLWPEVSARQAYPLYYGLARPFVATASAANPARGLNLFSAIWAAAAVGLLSYVCARVTRSIAAGAVAGLLLAVSYTFWSQAIIAEVYSLHLALTGACLLALYAYEAHPRTSRLALFLAIYAVAFGNHLSMILLLVPFAAFLLRTPGRRRELLRPQIVGLAALIAIAGALQYLPNLLSVWWSADAPASVLDRLAAFWFDTTKADWRESMVLGIRSDQALDRLAMWWFDMRQQFGIAGVAIAAAGAVALWRTSRAWAGLVLGIYGITAAFALTYNVGDAHVFFLPAHYAMAFFAGAAVAALSRVSRVSRVWSTAVVVVAVFAYAGWRGWSTWPAVDRHADRRAEQLIARLTLGLTDRDALFVSQMNWQLENVLLYAARHERPDLAWVRLPDVMPHFPFLVSDNHRISRDLVVSAEAAAEITSDYAAAYPLLEDPSIAMPGLSEIASQIPLGSPYVLAVLTPPREEVLDPDVLAGALESLSARNIPERTPAAFELFAGISGEPPIFYRASDRPFEAGFTILDEPFTVRMDSWLPSDTFRRAGFGHVLRGRDHALILERGVNLVWLQGDGTPSAPFYAASLFAPKPRFRISPATLQLAQDRPQAPGRRAQQ